jgi:trk system potassium uptake protein TrkA
VWQFVTWQGQKENQPMKMIVVGCGRLGAGLANRLFEQGHEVVVLDEYDPAFDNLPPGFRGRTVNGDAVNHGVLERAGVEKADGLAAVTSSDMVNAIVAHIARTIYNVPYVVSRNYDPAYLRIHETFGLQTVSSTIWGAQRIEEILYHGQVHTIFSAGNGEVEIYELTIPAAWEGHKLSELLAENESVPVAITRTGKAFIPQVDTALLTGDLLQISATMQGAVTIRKRIQSQGDE